VPNATPTAVVRLLAVALIISAGGCITSTVPGIVTPPAADTVCTRGALTTGDSVVGHLTAANGCRTIDLFQAETTYANEYTLPVQAGQGYLVSMGSIFVNPFFRVALELVGPNSAGHDSLLGYDTYYYPARAALPFVAPATGTYKVRATVADSVSSDSGGYSVRLQTCKVPVAGVITDSTTHDDTLGPSDCVMPRSNFYVGDTTRVQMYAMHVDTGMARTLTFTSASPLVVVVGSQFDPFLGLTRSYGVTAYDVTNGTLEVAPPHPGTYTIIVGTYGFVSAPTPYTLTVGGQHAPPP
jgi:hypothetical protein